MYKVIERFADLQDNKHIYEVGDEFPRLGVKVSAERLSRLSSNLTTCGRPVIAKVEEEVPEETPKEAPAVQEVQEEQEVPKPKPTKTRAASKRSNKK